MARLFCAIPVPGAVQDELRAAVGAQLPDAVFRLPDARTIHITLAFIGEVSPGTADRLPRLLSAIPAAQKPKSQLASPSPITAQDSRIELTGVGVFPQAHDPRIVWIGVTSPSRTTLLQDLRRQLVTSLRNGNVSVDSKPFRPHLTVAYRRRRASQADARHAIPRLETALRDRSWTIGLHRIVLYESTLTPGGAVHRPLQAVDVSI